MGAKKTTTKKPQEEHFISQVNWQQIGIMTGCKKSVLEKQSPSNVKVGGGWQICENQNIVEQLD